MRVLLGLPDGSGNPRFRLVPSRSAGYTLPHEWLEPGEPERPGVEIYTPLDSVLVEPAAFRRFVERYLATLCAAVHAQDHPWGKLPDWPRVEAQLRSLAAEAR